MFSKTVGDYSNLLDCTFIVGIPLDKIILSQSNHSFDPRPECLFCLPEEEKSSINEGVLDVIHLFKISSFSQQV